MEKNNLPQKNALIKTAKFTKIAESIRDKVLTHTKIYPTLKLDGFVPNDSEIINTVNKELTPQQIQQLYNNPDSQDSKMYMQKIAESLEFKAKSKKRLWDLVDDILNDM